MLYGTQTGAAPGLIAGRGEVTLGVQGAEPLAGGQSGRIFSAKIVIETLSEHVFPC